MTGIFLNMVGIYLYLMLVRLVSLFKTESEAKLLMLLRLVSLFKTESEGKLI